MIKLACIDPTPHRTFRMERMGYHLVLAQKLLTDQAYREWYRVNRKYGMFVIVDNGAAENDTPHFTEVLQVAEYIGYDEIVLPDVVNDHDGTIAGLDDLSPELLHRIPHYKRLVVPQGETLNDWFSCLSWIQRHVSFSTVGVSKYHPTNRFYLLEALRNQQTQGLGWPNQVHALGVVGNPVEELKRLAYEHPWIRGIDTGAAVAWAQNGRELQPGMDSPRCSLDWTKSYDGRLAALNVHHLLQGLTPRQGVTTVTQP